MSTTSDSALLKDLGERLKAERLRQNVTQGVLAERTGLARKTIVNVEAGKGGSLGTLVALLRGLGRLDALDGILPDSGLSPIQLSDLRGKERQRATGSRGNVASTTRVAEDSPEWKWGDER